MKNTDIKNAKGLKNSILNFWATNRGKVITIAGGTVVAAALVTTGVLSIANNVTAQQMQPSAVNNKIAASTVTKSKAQPVSPSVPSSSVSKSCSSKMTISSQVSLKANIIKVSSTPTHVASTASKKKSNISKEPAKKGSRSSGRTTHRHNRGSGSGHVSNYQGVNKTLIFTDEITGIKQTVRLGGVGAGYREVAGGGATLNTTAAMGATHKGFNATVSLTGTNGIHQGGATAVAKNGIEPEFTFSNLTAGTYTLKLTAHDGTVVAKYQFSVDSNGNVH